MFPRDTADAAQLLGPAALAALSSPQKTPQEGTGPARTCRARAAQLPQAGQRSVCVSMCARACDTKTDGWGDWSLSLKSRTPKAAPSSDLLPCFLGLPRPSRVLGHEGAD